MLKLSELYKTVLDIQELNQILFWFKVWFISIIWNYIITFHLEDWIVVGVFNSFQHFPDINTDSIHNSRPGFNSDANQS